VSRVAWLSPSPLWDDLAGGPAFRQPTLLRFASDAFMQELQGTLESRPAGLRGFVAQPETWRRPAAGLPPRDDTTANGANGSGGTATAALATAAPATAATSASAEAVKLYQPVHGRFYLVTAALACRVPGLPEHTVDLAAGESVAFVVRRLMRGADGAPREMAWVAAEGAAGWTEAPGSGVLPMEERLPMFGTYFQPDDEQPRRRLFAGFIPVDRREQYIGARVVAAPAANGGGGAGGAGAAPAAPGAPAVPAAPAEVTVEDPRVLDFQREVLEPWVGLWEWYDEQLPLPNPLRSAREAAVQAGPLILLDLASWLETELPDVWAVVSGAAGVASLNDKPEQKTLYDSLAALRLWRPDASGSLPFWTALSQAHARRDELESNTLQIGQPPSLPAGVTAVLITVDPRQPGQPAAVTTDRNRLRDLLRRDTSLPADAPGVNRRPLLHLAIRALQEAAPPAVPGSVGAGASGVASAAAAAAQRPRLPALAPADAQGDDEFVIRCVYTRPQCGRGAESLVSDASPRFRLASFFDPEAPQRTIRVALPVDTSPAALRKYDRNVAFVLSDQLSKQISRVKGMQALIDGDVEGEPRGLDISLICSLSIPIITICALILLMIIVSLLNIVFWWLPFFKICLPVPSLKAKG
jgi:hypothetical protein